MKCDFRNAYNNSGTDEDHTRQMTKAGQRIEWSQIKELSKQTTDGWRVYQLPPEAINLNNFSKMRVSLMEKVIASLACSQSLPDQDLIYQFC